MVLINSWLTGLAGAAGLAGLDWLAWLTSLADLAGWAGSPEHLGCLAGSPWLAGWLAGWLDWVGWLGSSPEVPDNIINSGANSIRGVMGAGGV